MSFHRRFRIQVGIRVLLITGAAFIGGALIAWTELYLVAAVLGAVAIYAAVGLVHYVEQLSRQVTQLLDSVRYSDYSQRFRAKDRGPLLNELSATIDEVRKEFRRVRADREEQVRYLKNVVRHVGIALVCFRSDGTVEIINRAARRLLSVGRVRTLDALRPFSEQLVQVMQQLGSGEQQLVRVVGETRTHQLSVYATKFRLRQESYTLVSLQDIGHELEEREMEAWQQLTRVLTHEIMNSVAPIASLAATANRLLDEGCDGKASGSLDDAVEALEVIEQRSESLISFVDTYRSFTHIPPPDFQLTPVESLLAHARRLLTPEKQSASITIKVEPESLTVPVDPDLMEQVLINLVLNALQAVEGQPDGCVTLRGRIDRRGIPVIEVIDNGPGIPEDVQERIFVPFFTTKEGGSGIGLSLSRQIMRLHGGTIGVRSAPGEGSTFRLRF